MSSIKTITLPDNEGHDISEDEIILNCCNIILITPEIYKFKNLTKLYLGNNKIYKIEAHFFLNLSQLQELDLSYNDLRTIPEIISLLSKLKKLYLNGNKLYSLPESIYYIPELEYLNVSNNRLFKISKHIYKSKQLHTLNVSYNKITTLPLQIIKCKNLHHIDISHNTIYYIYPKVKQFLEMIYN